MKCRAVPGRLVPLDPPWKDDAMQSSEDAVRVTAAEIPPGSVMTYGDIAVETGLHPRQVGQIVARVSSDIPWWRVVRADGTPAACHGGTAPSLLAQEHVPFVGDKVDLRRLRSGRSS